MTTPFVYIIPINSDLEIDNYFTLDMIQTFTPNFTQRLTQYTLSDKSTISNHVVKSNQTFNISGTISPISLSKFQRNVVSYNNPSERTQIAYDWLVSQYNNATELTLVTDYDTYTPVVITNVTPVRTKGTSLDVTINLEKARKSSYKRVKVALFMDQRLSTDAKNNTYGSTGTTKNKEEDGGYLTYKLFNDNAKFFEKTFDSFDLLLKDKGVTDETVTPNQ